MRTVTLTIATTVAAALGLSLAPAAQAATYSKDHPLRVALMISGNLGDKSFFDSAAVGMKRAEADLPVTVKIIEAGPNPSAWEPAFADAADGDYDLIMTGTYAMGDAVAASAKEHPDKKFVLYDETVKFETGCCNNVLSIVYRTSTAGYLAGYAAAKVSKTGTLGEIIGMEVTPVLEFAVGFDQGAKAANPNVKILKANANSFTDSAKGKELALAQMQAGADVIFPIAGAVGLGSLQAVRDQNKLAVGVDSDQAALFGASDPAQAKVIMTSVEKKVGDSLYTALKEIVDGTAPFGTSQVLGLKEGAVGLSDNSIYQQAVPAPVRAEVEALKTKIIDGEIKVDSLLK